MLVYKQFFRCIVLRKTIKKMARTVAIVYQTTTLEEAQLRVALVERRSADLLVHRVSSRGLAQRDSLWYITRDRQSATTLLCFTAPGMAQLKICFVDSYGEAGWQVPRPRHIHL